MAVNPRDSLFAQAKAVIPGGVNSPARSFAGVGGSPVFMRRGEGALIYDEHGKEYIDYCMSWGPLIFGHAPEIIVSALKKALDDGTTFGTATCKEIEFAQLIADAVPCVEKVRLTNSGTEAVMGALRLARAFTRRRGILKFQGAYHGHADYLLVKAGSGLATLGVPDSAGVPHSFTQHTLIAPFNNLEAVEKILRNWYSDLACIIVEPVMGNYGVIPPSEHFLKGLRKLADDYNMLLVFDEVITGFRLAYGGAQEYFGVTPDLCCLGKIIGGGLPMGAFGGRADIMNLLAPEGSVYQAGTFSGNPLAVTAGIASLTALRDEKPYRQLENMTSRICGQIESAAQKHDIQLRINRIGSMFSLFFCNKPVTDYLSASCQDKDRFKKLFHHALETGLYFPPSPYESFFLSTAHTEKHCSRTIDALIKIFRKL